MPNKPCLLFKYLADDPQHHEICDMYWARDKNGFVYKVEDIAAKFYHQSRQISYILPKLCQVWFCDSVCRRCHRPTEYVKNRTAYSNARQHKGLCHECEERLELDEAVTRKTRQEKQMQEAYDGGIYESLAPLEYAFLNSLARTKTLEEASKCVGISLKLGEKLLAKLNDVHLVNRTHSNKYYLLRDLENALVARRCKKAVKSVFGSPKAERLYKVLKRKYLFVFPEIPICTFTEREMVSHLFTESWHSGYFLTARVDFVVCDEHGYPEIALEYQGGYHDSKEQQVKDRFKQEMVNEVGIALRWIDAESLKELESNKDEE